MRVSTVQDDERSRIVSSWRKSVCRWVTQLRRLSRFTGRVIGGGPSGGGTVELQWWYSGRRTYAKSHSPSTATAYSVRTTYRALLNRRWNVAVAQVRFTVFPLLPECLPSPPTAARQRYYAILRVKFLVIQCTLDPTVDRFVAALSPSSASTLHRCAIVTRFLRPSNSARLCWKHLNNNLRRRYLRSRIVCLFGNRTTDTDF